MVPYSQGRFGTSKQILRSGLDKLEAATGLLSLRRH